MMDSFSDSGSSISSSSSSSSHSFSDFSSSSHGSDNIFGSSGDSLFSSSSSHSFSDFSSSSHGSDSISGSSGGSLFSSGYGASLEGGGGSSGGGGATGSWGNDSPSSSSSAGYDSGSRSSENSSNWADLSGGQSDKAYGPPSSAESNWHSSTGQENLTSLPDTPGHIEGHVNPQDKYGYTVEYIPGERESIVFSDERPDGVDKPRGGSSGLDNFPEGSVHKGQSGEPEGLDRNGFFPSDNIRSDSGYGQQGGYEPTSGALTGNSFDLSRVDHTGIGPNQPFVDRPLGIVYDPNQTLDTVFKANSPSVGGYSGSTIDEIVKLTGIAQTTFSVPRDLSGLLVGGQELFEQVQKYDDLPGKLGPVPSVVALGGAINDYMDALRKDDLFRASDIAMKDILLNVASLALDAIKSPWGIAADLISASLDVNSLAEATKSSHENKGNKE